MTSYPDNVDALRCHDAMNRTTQPLGWAALRCATWRQAPISEYRAQLSVNAVRAAALLLLMLLLLVGADSVDGCCD